MKEIESLHPGPINNHDLVIEGSTDLKTGLYETLDYFLFPMSLYKTFESIYGGGPPICRKVISTGKHTSRTQVELYPIKVEVYLESDVSQTDDFTTLAVHKNIYLSRTCNIKESFETICKETGPGKDKCRLWIYIADEDSNEPDDEATIGRKLTTDITDKINGWMFFRKVDATFTLDDLNVSCIKVMLEFQAYDVTTGKSYWPKDDALNEWKNHLRVGDVVDAVDECSDWYESEIKAIDIHSR